MKKLLLILIALVVVGGGVWLFRDRLPGQRQAGQAGPALPALAADAPARFVPADSPYVFASLAPLPDAMSERWESQMTSLMPLWQAQLEPLRQQADADPTTRALLEVLDRHTRGKTPREALASIGFALGQPTALYGIGVLPVLRAELADPDRTAQFIEELAQAAGGPTDTAEIDGHRYWRLLPKDAPLGGVVAIIDRQLVATLVPTTVDDEVLRTLLGLTRPTRSIVDSGALQAIAGDYGFSPYALGFVDSQHLLDAVTGPASAVDQAFLAALDLQKPTLEGACASEWPALARSWPRLVLGYDRLDPGHFDQRTVLETTPDIVEALRTLRAPIPGLDAADDGILMHIGFGLKLDALPTVVNRFADRVAQAPWQCPALQPLNDAFAQAKAQSANPAVYAVAPAASAIHIAITDLNTGGAGATPSGSGLFVIGSDNPASLEAMARQWVPQFASLKLSPGAPPEALPTLPGMPTNETAHAARTEHAIGVAIGDAVDRLPAFLELPAQPGPLLVAGVSSRFYVVMADLVEQQIGSAAALASADDEARQQVEQNLQMMRSLYQSMAVDVAMQLDITERGIELRQQTSFEAAAAP